MKKTFFGLSAVHALPEGYAEYDAIDLKSNKKIAIFVNVLAVALAAAMAIPAHFFLVPVSVLFDMENGIGEYSVRFLSLIALMILYLVLHELVHGAAMKLCGTEKVKFGFTGIYAFAGSDDFYDKKSYIFVALAPVVLWGIVLAAVNFFVPETWFWVVYLIQICNISGAAGDFFVTVRFLRFPKDVLVRDVGIRMTVYSKERKAG